MGDPAFLPLHGPRQPRRPSRTPLLMDALQDRAPETRIYAALALGRLRDPAEVPPLLKAFSEDERDVRKAAAIALARFGDTRAIGVLREMLDRSRLDQVAGMRPDQKEETM